MQAVHLKHTRIRGHYLMEIFGIYCVVSFLLVIKL